MFHTLSNVQYGEALSLQQYVDNRDGNLLVGLRSIAYTVGWYNLDSGESLSWRRVGGPQNILDVGPGLWSFNLLKDFIEMSGINGSLEVSKTNGRITFTVPGGQEVKLTDGLLALLGLDDGLGGQWLDAGSYSGDHPVNFAPTKTLNIHLDQVNTTQNIVDGAPSTLLTRVGIERQVFGDIHMARIEHPEFKCLQEGTIGELKITVRDDNGKIVDNHNLPISLVLEICQK